MKATCIAACAALCVGFVPAVVLAAGQPLGIACGDFESQVVLVYQPDSGELGIMVGRNEKSEGLSTFQLESASGMFRSTNARFYPPSFPNVATANRLYYVHPAGFAYLGSKPWSLGNVLPTWLNWNILLEDLLVDGSYKSGGNLMKYGRPPALLGLSS